MAKKYRACLFFLITGMGVMISAGVAANPVPEPDITIEKGPGPSDVSIIIGCWSSALEPCMDMKYYRDGKEFPCKMEDYNPTKASSYSYDPDNHAHVQDAWTGIPDVQEDPGRENDGDAGYTRDQGPGKNSDYEEITYIQQRCIDRCVPLGIHRYEVKTFVLENPVHVEKTITISQVGPSCSFQDTQEPQDNQNPDNADSSTSSCATIPQAKGGGSVLMLLGMGLVLLFSKKSGW